MTLSITNNVVYDESFTLDTTDNDVASLSFSLPALGSFITSPTGFPQYAELSTASFVDTSTLGGPVTDYSLSGWDSTLNGGAGGLKALSTSTGVATDLYVGADRVYLFAVSGNSNVVVGRAGTGSASDPIAVVIALNETVVSGQVTAASLGMAVYGPLVHLDGTKIDDGDVRDLTNLVSLTANFATSQEHDFDSFAGVPSGSDAFAMILPDTTNNLQLIASGFTGTTNQKITISQDANAGSIGGGGPGQHVGSGNSLRIDFVTGGDFTKADTSSEDNNYANISYGQHTTNAFQTSFQIVQVNPTGNSTSLKIFAYDVPDNAQGTTFATEAAASEGDAVPIDPANVIILDAAGHAITPAAGQITATGDGVLITGLQLNYTVKFSTPGDTFDRFTVTNAQPAKGNGSNITFDIGHIHVSTLDVGAGSASAELGSHLVFEDGGPSFGANGSTIPNVQVDETTLGVAGKSAAIDFSTLFHPNYGPDGAAASSPLTYALGLASTTGVDSGLKDTATGHEIYLFMDGANVVGKVGTGSAPDSSGAVDFTISVSSDGKVTLQQDHAVIHSDPNAIDEAAHLDGGSPGATAALVTLTATAKDGDGDSVNSTALNIGGAFTILDDEPHSLGAGSNVTVGNTTSATDPDGAGPLLAGAGSGSFATFNAGNDGVGSFTLVGPADTSGHYTWAYNDTSHSSITESFDGSPLFSLALDSSTGSYAMTMLGTLPNTELDLDANKIHAGGPTSHTLDVGVVGTSTDDVLITGNPGPINASNGNVGVSNGNVDSGETLMFQLYTDISHSTLIPFLGINVGTKSAGAATYHVTGVLDAAGHAVVDLGNYDVGKNGTIHVVNNALLDSITVSDVSGNAIKIGIAGISLLLPPVDAGFSYTAQLADGDGDHVSSPFNVFIDGNNDGLVDTAHVLFPA